MAEARSVPPACETLAVASRDRVWHVTLNRPGLRNAMSLRMVEELRAVLAQAERSGEVRAIVLRGAGGHFCAGADLKDMGAARQRELAGERDAVAEANARFGALCAAFGATGLATVAVLEGAVMGGGLGLACVVDVAIAGAGARLRLPETALGLVPAQIAAFLVERCGPSQARRLAVTGGTLTAAQALAVGLVHEMHDDGALDAALDATLAQILQCAPGAIVATKALMARARHEPASALVADAARAFADAARGPEGIEGTMAFLDKRPPSWSVR
ncbi:MAG: enoyl-CoA hydratase/isomerase family protein [Burkholderiaceae bacterium]